MNIEVLWRKKALRIDFHNKLGSLFLNKRELANKINIELGILLMAYNIGPVCLIPFAILRATIVGNFAGIVLPYVISI